MKSESACVLFYPVPEFILMDHALPSVNLISNWLTRADEAKTRNRPTSHTQRSLCACGCPGEGLRQSMNLQHNEVNIVVYNNCINQEQYTFSHMLFQLDIKFQFETNILNHGA